MVRRDHMFAAETPYRFEFFCACDTMTVLFLMIVLVLTRLRAR